MKRICFYRFPLEMKEFLFKVAGLVIKEAEQVDALWVDPTLADTKIANLLTMDLPEQNNLQEHSLDERRRAVIYLGGFAREELNALVSLFRKAIQGNMDVIFSAQTPTNLQWSFNRLWHDVVEDHDYFKELEAAHRENRPFTLVPDDDKPTSL